MTMGWIENNCNSQNDLGVPKPNRRGGNFRAYDTNAGILLIADEADGESIETRLSHGIGGRSEHETHPAVYFWREAGSHLTHLASFTSPLTLTPSRFLSSKILHTRPVRV